MEGFPSHRASGGADLPPHPQPPPPPQKQHQAPPYWYPPPAPASSSSPHPQPPPYSVPPYHHYPPPQPHPHNQQWIPPAYAPQPQPHAYAPVPAPSHAYQPGPPPPPPPPPMPPHPPQQMAPYPPPNQAWTNQPWPPNQGQHYPGASIPQNEGEDWAAKAKAWAAAKSITGRPADQSYLPQKEVSHANGETPLASSQNINAGGGGVAAAGADPATLVSPVQKYNSFSAVYEQEVPSYSSSQGNKDILPLYDNTQDRQPFAVPPVQDRYYHPQPDPSYMVNYGHNTHAGAVGVAGHDAVAAPHLWAPPGSVGPYPPPMLPPLRTQQYDIPTAVHPSVPVPNYGPPNIPPAAFNIASHLNTELYHGDPSALNQVNQSKKSAVPSWLREEILKKKTSMGSNSSAQVGSDGGERSPEATDQTDSKSVDSTKSAEEEDDEDEVEAARTAAINQEIKRILTEVLLKVTDDLFDEIATKVLSEDEMAGEGTGEPTALVKSKTHSSAPSTSGNAKIQDKGANGSASSAMAVVPDESTKGGVLLGLSDYDTDDEGDDENASTDRIKQNLETEMTNSSSLIKKDVLSDQNLAIHEESTELNLKREDVEAPSHSEGIVDTKFEEESHSKEESHVEVETGQATEGEIPQDKFVDGNNNIEKAKLMIDSEDIERSREGNRGSLRDEEEKDKEEKDERIDCDILKDKRQGIRGDDRETERRDDQENKLDGLKDCRRETSKEERDKTAESDGKEDKRERSKEEKERKTERRDDKEDSSKDRRERSREEKERKAERRDDKEDSSKDRRERSREERERKAERRDDGEQSSRGKSERSKVERERETDKRDDKERSRRSKRSQSPRGRSRSKENSRASREHSESIKRRRTESNKRNMSRSPPRSRHRRDSRSPHSKHSHHRNSAYSTTDRRTSRSRTPTRRRRSRSRTPSKRR